jgi:hypothetical protein
VEMETYSNAKGYCEEESEKKGMWEGKSIEDVTIPGSCWSHGSIWERDVDVDDGRCGRRC